MKKFIYAILLALPVLFFASCSDDENDVPDVRFNVTFSGGTNVDGVVYAVQGTDLKVESIEVYNNEPNKQAMITSATYYWDHKFIYTNIFAPYGIEIELPEDDLTEHVLEIECPLYAEDKSAAKAFLSYKIMVVESEEDIPEDAQPTVTTKPILTE